MASVPPVEAPTMINFSVEATRVGQITDYDKLILEIQKNFADRMIYVEMTIPHTRMDLVNLFFKLKNLN